MKIKTTICALAAALSFGGCNAARHRSYVFNGEIDGEKINFHIIDNLAFNDNLLDVTREDGTLVSYKDELEDNLKIESVCITPVDGIETCYHHDDKIDKEALAEAQTQFDGYLTKILEYKQQEAMKHIKKESLEVKK